MTEQMQRFNEGKRKLSLLPTAFIEALDNFQGPLGLLLETTKVLEFGAEKYSANNWRKGGSWMEVFNSGLRHAMAYQNGEELDPESGLHHLGHLGCNIAFLLEFERTNTGDDDRYYVAGKSEPCNGSWLEHLLYWRDGGSVGNLSEALWLLAEEFEDRPIFARLPNWTNSVEHTKISSDAIIRADDIKVGSILWNSITTELRLPKDLIVIYMHTPEGIMEVPF